MNIVLWHRHNNLHIFSNTVWPCFSIFHSNSTERLSQNGTKSTPPPWSSQEIRGTLGGGSVPWQCVPDHVYPVSSYGPPKNINQAAYQNRSNNNPETCATPAVVDTNRNSSMTTTTDDGKTTASSASAAVGQSIKSSKSFESGVLGQHANTPNGVIPWPGDRGKPRVSHQWDHHNGTPSSPHHNNLHHQQQQQQHHHQQQQQHHHQQHQQQQNHQHNGSSPYSGGGGGGGEILYLGNRSSGIRTSSRSGPTYFSPQHNHVSLHSSFDLLELWRLKFANSKVFSSSRQRSTIYIA